MDAMYVIGEPGVGKSTFVKHLTAGLPYEDGTSPFAFRRYDCGVWELGARRPDFPGTDALGMSVQPTVEEFLTGMRPKMLLAEGDRLGNAKFFDFLLRTGYNLHVVAIVGPEVARIQRSLRGSEQNDSWLKGRQTKVRKLMDSYPHALLPAGLPPQQMVDRLGGLPVIETLQEARLAVL